MTCQHPTIIEGEMPRNGWKPGILKRHCGECYHWLNDDNKAPALGE